MSFLQKTRNYYFIILLFLASSCEQGEIYPWSEESLDKILDHNLDKMVLVDFETDWWTWCDRLDSDTYTDEKIIEFAKNNLISIKIDAEKGDGPEQKIKYRIGGYPTILVLDSLGNEMDRIVGYRPPEEFLKELIRIKNGENTLSDLQAKYENNSGDISLQFNIAKKYIDLNVPDSA